MQTSPRLSQHNASNNQFIQDKAQPPHSCWTTCLSILALFFLCRKERLSIPTHICLSFFYPHDSCIFFTPKEVLLCANKTGDIKPLNTVKMKS